MVVSNHAQQRYAERIMDRDNKSDVAVYVAANKDKIDNDINLMVEYGKMIYSGKLEKGQNVTNVYLKDTWVILVDPGTKKVITLYSIDLGVGSDFNKEYVNLLLGRLEEEQKVYQEKNDELLKLIGELKDQQSQNKDKINEYRKLANDLEKANENLSDVIADYETQRYVAEENVRDIIEVLIGKKIK